MNPSQLCGCSESTCSFTSDASTTVHQRYGRRQTHDLVRALARSRVPTRSRYSLRRFLTAARGRDLSASATWSSTTVARGGAVEAMSGELMAASTTPR